MNGYQPVMQQQFDEVVASTTSYLQQLMDRVGELESKVEALESKPARSTAKKETTE